MMIEKREMKWRGVAGVKITHIEAMPPFLSRASKPAEAYLALWRPIQKDEMRKSIAIYNDID